MQEEEYTFVTIDDNDDGLFTDAVVVDFDSDVDLQGVVIVDESMGLPDFITISDDTMVLFDNDIIESYSSDINDLDISIIL